MRFKILTGIILTVTITYLSPLTVHAQDNQTVSAGFSKYIDSIEIQPVEYRTYEIPDYSGFKSYMPYTLFCKKSNQYTLQQICITDSDGFRRVDDCYVIALGSYFDVTIGQKVDLVLDNGEIIHCVVGDQKDDKHTDAQNLFTKANNCMSEFIIDSNTLDSTVKKRGDASYLASQNWNSPICEVRKYDDNVLG